MATYKSEILIEDESVWSTQTSVPKQTVQLDVSRFTGKKELKFKLTKTGGDGPTPPPPPLGPFGGHPTLAIDLLLHYSMGNNAANKVVTDDTPNAYHGVSARNTNLMSDGAGVIDNCFLFNGTSDLVTLPDITGEFSLVDPRASVCMWLKLNNAPPLAGSKTGLCDLGQSAWPNVTAYPWTNNICYYDIFYNARRTVSLVGGVDESTWHLLTVTTQPGVNGHIVYQNAVPIATIAGSVAIFMRPVPLLGSSNTPGGLPNWFDGRMDQVGIWNKTLTPAEITDYYNGGAGLAY